MLASHVLIRYSCPTVRSRDRINHLFIHLNLCIALALGLIVFIAGIENATSHEACITNKVDLCIIHIIIVRLQVCSSTVAVFFHICFLLDVM